MSVRALRPRDGRGRASSRRRSAASPTARARSSATPAAGSCWRSTFALERRGCRGPLRYAELARALGVAAGRGRAARRRARGGARRCAAARAWCSTRPTRTPSSAGSFFTNPILEPDEFAALERRAGRPPRFPEPDGRVKTSAAWLIERAGLPARLRRSGRDRDLLQAHARAHQPRRRHDRRAARAGARDRGRRRGALRRHACSRSRRWSASSGPRRARCPRSRVARARALRGPRSHSRTPAPAPPAGRPRRRRRSGSACRRRRSCANGAAPR